jgi:hypothetical protein
MRTILSDSRLRPLFLRTPFFTFMIADLHHTEVNPERTVSNVIHFPIAPENWILPSLR